jgi:hypothetical protein
MNVMYVNDTAERLADRFLDLRAVQNLMGKYVFSMMICKERTIYQDYWTRTKSDPALGLNNGWYRGAQAIQDYYQAVADQTEVQSKTIQSIFPEQLGGLSDEELYGTGRMNLRPLTNPIVEIAGDGQTAKGFWQVMGVDNEITDRGPLSTFRWGYVGADFVREDGEWKVWHLLMVDDVVAPVGSDWAAPAQYPQLPDFSKLQGLKLPAPTEEREVFRAYSTDRPFTPPIPAPVPYETFDETFSYAQEGRG